jgi:hypothetical protein
LAERDKDVAAGVDDTLPPLSVDRLNNFRINAWQAHSMT